MPLIRITVDGRVALTVEQAAARHGQAAQTMRQTLARLHKAGALAPCDMLDERKPLYWAAELDAAMKARPGKGAHLRKPAAS